MGKEYQRGYRAGKKSQERSKSPVRKIADNEVKKLSKKRTIPVI